MSSTRSIQPRAPDTLDTIGAVQISGSGLNCRVLLQSRTVVVVNVKKIVGLLAIALLLFFVFTQPDNAAGSVTSIGTTLRDGAESVIRFVTQLV
jgi:hypothetical protein